MHFVLRRRNFLLGSAAFLTSCGSSGGSLIVSPPLKPSLPSISEQTVLLDDLQKRTFDFFWETVDDERGLTPDRYPTRTFCSVASIGFALTAYCIGVSRNYVTRQRAAVRTHSTLKYLLSLPQGDAAKGMAGHHGFFYHFLNYEDGTRYKDCELSSIDTTLLLYGALSAQVFFDQSDEIESEIRKLAQELFDRVDWQFFVRPSGLLTMGWKPESGFIKSEWEGYSEGILIYLLATASKTSPVAASAWDKWCSTYDLTWGTNMGNQEHVGYFSLMVHQLANVWHDMRNISDKYMKNRGLTYFENARRATLTQKIYATNNPLKFKDYDENTWGFAACDGPYDGEITIDGIVRKFRSYSERGPGTRAMFDDGTIAPTGALSSIALTPNESIAVLKNLRDKYGDDIYGKYGFYDSFNPTFDGSKISPFGHQTAKAGWVSNDYLGIDQGPILAMAENYRTGMIWDLMKKSEIIKAGLKKCGFSSINKDGNWLDG